jgi:hypothetical protein
MKKTAAPQMLQRLEQVEIPPLSQSRQEDMACDLLYQARHIHGVRTESEASRRGNEVHRIIAKYMDYLGVEKVQTGYDKMAELSADAGAEAKEILDRFTESWFIDAEKIYDTELYISVDHEFKVIEAHGRSQRREVHPDGVMVEGLIDLVVANSETDWEIYDWKSYYQIVDADTFQSKLYPLLLMLLNPAIERVRFILSFVRYGDAQRDVLWNREDVPRLKEMVMRERRRQVDLHVRPELEFKATPGKQCSFCPLLLTECPMQKVNPYANLEPSKRVALALWMAAAKRENDRILKDWIAQNGPVIYRDENGTEYRGEFARQDRKGYELGQAYPLLESWIEGHPEDRDFFYKLTVSGLSSPLKAKKRAALDVEMQAIATVKTITRLKVGRPGEKDEFGDE